MWLPGIGSVAARPVTRFRHRIFEQLRFLLLGRGDDVKALALASWSGCRENRP
jgi:hypothetical protein